MKLRILLSIMVLLIVGGIVQATPQDPDFLTYEGKRYPIYGAPLEKYFKANPDRRPKFCGGMSSLWRGYVAEMEIVGAELFLNDIKIHTVNPHDPTCLKESKLDEVSSDGKKFKIDWLSGVLTSGHGEYVGGEDAYSTWKIWEKYTLFYIKKGSLESVRHFTNAEYQEFLKEKE